MAATKQSLKDSRSPKEIMEDLSKQVLCKPLWKSTNNGGKVREWVVDCKGVDMVRLTSEDEVVPDKTFYIKDPLRSNFFLETVFHPLVDWDSILEFIQTKKLYTKYGNERQISKTEGSHLRTTDQRLF
jgi:hypothetical protein